MAMKTGICKLCLQEKPLLKKSHIIPDFIYRDGGLYHSGHIIKKINLDAALEGQLVEVGIHRDGMYDKHILCEDCDNSVIGSLESYARPVLYGDKTPGIEGKRKRIGNVLILTDIDYTKMKLFFLSILWRASISKHSVFNEVEIQPRALEKLRVMILNNKIDDHKAFPLIFLTCSDKRWGRTMLPPVGGIKRTTFFVLPKITFITTRNIEEIQPSNRIFQIFPNGEMRLQIFSKNEFISLLKTIQSKG